MLTVAAVFVLRWRSPDLARPFRTPGYPLVPAIYLVGTGLLTAAVFYERPVVSSISLLSIAAGVPVYYLWTSARCAAVRTVKPEKPEDAQQSAGAGGGCDGIGRSLDAMSGPWFVGAARHSSLGDAMHVLASLPDLTPSITGPDPVHGSRS